MKTLVINDSAFGNTTRVAEAIAGAIGDAELHNVHETIAPAWSSLDLVVVGSPTQGGRPTKAVQRFLDAIPANALANATVAAFDTRIDVNRHGVFLHLLMGAIGYAAGRIEKQLVAKGGRVVAKPAGFFVDGKEGPVTAGELERATRWASALQSGAAARA